MATDISNQNRTRKGAAGPGVTGTRPPDPKSASSTSNSSTGNGMFNFQQIMDDFYKSEPTDEAGKAMKQAYQGNLVQSGFDSMLGSAVSNS